MRKSREKKNFRLRNTLFFTIIVEKDLLSKKALSEKLVFYYFDYIEAFFKNQ